MAGLLNCHFSNSWSNQLWLVGVSFIDIFHKCSGVPLNLALLFVFFCKIDITDSNFVSPLWCLMIPQLILAAEITCEFLNWVVFPFPHSFSLCLSLFPTPALNQHSLTAWTLCCAYCSVTHISSFFSKKGLFHQNQRFLWSCRSWHFVSSYFNFLLIWPFCTSCGCIQIRNYSKQVSRDLHKMYFATLSEVQY